MNFFTEADLAENGKKSLPAAASGAHIGIRPEHLTSCTEAKALVGGTLDLGRAIGRICFGSLGERLWRGLHCENGASAGNCEG